MYFVVLKNYDSLYAVKTNAYNDDVKGILRWYFGSWYEFHLVVQDPIIIHTSEYLLEPREAILEELEWKIETYHFDEEGEDLDKKVEYLKSILVD